MASSTNEQSVLRYWKDVWSEGGLRAVEEFYAHTFRLNGDETTVEQFWATEVSEQPPGSLRPKPSGSGA